MVLFLRACYWKAPIFQETNFPRSKGYCLLIHPRIGYNALTLEEDVQCFLKRCGNTKFFEKVGYGCGGIHLLINE